MLLYLFGFVWICKSANHIIFLDYLTTMKSVVPENFDFQCSKNFLRIRFFAIGLKIGPDLHKHIPYGTKIA